MRSSSQGEFSRSRSKYEEALALLKEGTVHGKDHLNCGIILQNIAIVTKEKIRGEKLSEGRNPDFKEVLDLYRVSNQDVLTLVISGE